MASLQSDNTLDQNLNIDKLTLDDVSDDDCLLSSSEESSSLWQRHSPHPCSKNNLKKLSVERRGKYSMASEDEKPYQDDNEDDLFTDRPIHQNFDLEKDNLEYNERFEERGILERKIPHSSQESLSDEELETQRAVSDRNIEFDEEFAVWRSKLMERMMKTEDDELIEKSASKKSGTGICIAELNISPLSKDSLVYNPNVQETKYNYGEVLEKSILFYEAQRSGRLPPNRRIEWRSDSCIDDKGHLGEDLSGGWYDSGHFIKFGLPMAWSTTVLAWGLIAFKDAYEEAGHYTSMLECIKWPADYFMKCHTKKYEFYYQVGDPGPDHRRWGRAEDMDIPRPSFKVDRENPGSDVVGETAAALAACAIVFKDQDPSYAVLLLKHAKQLFKFADKYRSNYPSAEYYTTTRSYGNKLCWAAAWLYYATNKDRYLNYAKELYTEFELYDRAYSFAWDDSGPGVQLLMYLLTGDEGYRDNFTDYFDRWMPYNEVPYTRKGLVYRNPWGSLRYAGNNAFLALMAANNGINMESSIAFATQQMHYILGDSGRSYVCGFGENHPVRPHHRESSLSSAGDGPQGLDALLSDDPNPHCLEGALVGGPDMEDYYTDTRQDYRANEVACDFNAGFQSAVAGKLRFKLFFPA
ncbi:uncharacterized protein LOC144445289 [Glandiceps talaboti]